MPALLIALAVLVGIQPGLAGSQDRDYLQDKLEGPSDEDLLKAIKVVTDPAFAMELLDRFKLYTGCAPLWLWVVADGNDAKAIGLTRDRLQAAAESRLRSARLHMSPETQLPKTTDPLQLPDLSVYVQVDSSLFLVNVELRKTLSDPASGEEMKAGTWESGRFGKHSGNAGYIVQLVAEELDKFLVEYLRVNEKDCSR